MATYFHGANEIQGGDGLQTLYLMNPSYAAAAAAGGYSDAPAQANMSFFMNNSQNPMNLSPSGGQAQHQQSQQHFVGIPLHPAADSGARQAATTTTTHDLSAIHQGLHYNLWTPTPASNRPLQQGLSLSLSSQQQQQQQAAPYAETKIVGSSSSPSSAAAAAASSNGMIGVQSVFMGSKYLKAAQQLLDEVVNVGKGGKLEQMTKLGREINDERRRAMKRDKDAEGAGGGEGDCGTKRGEVELTTAERQELQMKKAKLANMLDEVEQRYRQYHHQMQMVVSSFETVAGFGSARTYTALALQTMSKQFRCLRDAISGQIKATCKSLGEEDCLGGGGSKSVGSRLRFVDHHLRQQRALQQLGTAQYNAWRPQRGLPERAVSVLRAWLFEHFLHPYPKDSDKHMLAKETGLTRSQVSNWFINARVRLWKPMVEEMYMEETKEQEQNTGDDHKTSKSEGSEHSASRSTSNHGQSPARTESFKQNQDSHPMRIQPSNLGIFDNHRNDDDSFMQQRLKKARTDESLHRASMLNPLSHEMKQQDDMSNRDLMMKFMDHGGGFGAYQIEQFDNEQFAPSFGGNGVSLTLGLPHCEPLPLSGSQQPTYLSNETIPLGRRLDIDMGSEEINYFSLNNNNSDNNPSASHPPNATYESINIQNRRRFAAQLLPDYVA